MSDQVWVERVESDDPRFRKLVAELDAFLAAFDGPDHAMYSGFNKVDSVKGAVVAFLREEPVGCGAFRQFEGGLGEVKRMYVLPRLRGRGVARAVLAEIEAWARELGIERLQLETGAELAGARKLYEGRGYEYIPNYEPYVGLDRSVCLAKDLHPA